MQEVTWHRVLGEEVHVPESAVLGAEQVQYCSLLAWQKQGVQNFPQSGMSLSLSALVLRSYALTLQCGQIQPVGRHPPVHAYLMQVTRKSLKLWEEAE